MSAARPARPPRAIGGKRAKQKGKRARRILAQKTRAINPVTSPQQNWERPSRLSLPSSQGIHGLQADEILFVIRDQNAIIRFGDRGDNHVEGTPRLPGRGPGSHQARPDKGGFLIEREHAAGEQRLGTLGAREPTFQLLPLLSGRLLKQSAPDLSDSQRGDKQILVGLFSHPRDERGRRRRFGDIADDICVEKVAAHRSTLRPATTGRVRVRSAPTRGYRRNALRMPPFLRGSPETVRRTVARIRTDSGPLSASRRASDRISSRSVLSPRTSNRAIPRWLRRFR